MRFLTNTNLTDNTNTSRTRLLPCSLQGGNLVACDEFVLFVRFVFVNLARKTYFYLFFLVFTYFSFVTRSVKATAET